MAMCGHQFRGGDESDWVLSTSAGSLNGSTTASKILQELFRKRCSKITNQKLRMKRQRSESNPPTENSPKSTLPEENGDLIVRKLTGAFNFDNFDESQHLNGCPVKWLYRKKLLDKNKMCKVGRLCHKRSAQGEEVKREKCKNVRDKTPIDVKIHKINLMDKYTSNYDEGCVSLYKPYFSEKSDGHSTELETHRKKLAAKLNWKLHDSSQEVYEIETSSEISSRQNYLPPRPLIGLKPLLSVLLSSQETNCCSLAAHIRGNPTREKAGPLLTIQSLDLPFFTHETRPRPQTTNTPRWGSKSSRLTKKLQVPNQITLKLSQSQNVKAPPPEGNLKLIHYSLPGKKLSERTKHTKSLSSLFYELKDKTSYRNQSLEYFEEMIRDLTMEEGEFKIKRFLNLTSGVFDSPRGDRILSDTKDKLLEAISSCESKLNLVCGKVRLSQKFQSSKKQKRDEERRRGSNNRTSTAPPPKKGIVIQSIFT